MRKVTNHSARNSIIFASSFEDFLIFWTALSAVSMSGTCVAEVQGRPCHMKPKRAATTTLKISPSLRGLCSLRRNPLWRHCCDQIQYKSLPTQNSCVHNDIPHVPCKAMLWGEQQVLEGQVWKPTEPNPTLLGRGYREGHRE